MESLVNYESDDGETKITKKHRSRESNDTGAKSTKSRSQRKQHRSRSDSSSQSDSDDDDDDDDDKRKRLIEDKSTSKSSRKHSDRHYRRSSSRDNDRHHRESSSRDNDRHHGKSSSRDNDGNDRKRKCEDRDDKSRKYRKSSRERRHSREKDKNRHRESSAEKRREKYDRKETKRRFEDRRQRERDNRDSRDSRDNRNNKDKYDKCERNDRYKDDHHKRRNDSPRDGKDSDNNHSSSEPKVPNSTNALRKAEALNRTIERRANEKVQQLQKLGIEIPAMMQHQQHQQLIQQQLQTQIQTAKMKALTAMSSMIPTLPNVVLKPQAIEQHATNEGNSDDNLNLNLTNFTSPILANARYTEQMQKKKLIWGAKKVAATNGDTVTTNNKWEAAKFSQDSDGKMASKFLRLMGMKNVPATASNADSNTTDTNAETDPSVEKREQMFNKMEQQYEIARQVTHTMRGMGLGFGSQSRPC